MPVHDRLWPLHLLCAAEKRFPYQRVHMDVFNGQSLRPEYMRITPSSTVCCCSTGNGLTAADASIGTLVLKSCVLAPKPVYRNVHPDLCAKCVLQIFTYFHLSYIHALVACNDHNVSHQAASAWVEAVFAQQRMHGLST